MGLFGKKVEAPSLGLIGMDIGATGMKAVELVPDKGRLKLERYAYTEMKKMDVAPKPFIDDPKRAAAVIQKMLKEADMKATKVNASLPANHVFHAIITIPQPKSPKEDIKPMVESQVRKLLPVPLENMILDTTIIDKELMPKVEAPTKKGEEKKDQKKGQELTAANTVDKTAQIVAEKQHVRILVSGAPKDLVQKYVEVFRTAKLELVALETESFALIRSLVGKDKSRIMIVDVGHERTNITIVEGGIPYLHRSVRAGGAGVTQMIAKQLGVGMMEADQAKKDLARTAATGDLPPVLQEAMMPMMHEIKYALELYAQQSGKSGNVVEKIILTGGSASLPQIDSFLTKGLNINVYIGDPWARIGSHPDMRPVLEEIGPRFSVSVGLAMRLGAEKQ